MLYNIGNVFTLYVELRLKCYITGNVSESYV